MHYFLGLTLRANLSLTHLSKKWFIEFIIKMS